MMMVQFISHNNKNHCIIDYMRLFYPITYAILIVKVELMEIVGG